MQIFDNIFYVGVDDTAIDLFEGQYRVPKGMCYNSYVIVDEKVAVMDGVDGRFADEWLQNIGAVLGERTPDYLIVQHMEPDHSAGIAALVAAYPEVCVVSSKQAFTMMESYFGKDFTGNRLTVSEGATLSLGNHELTFVAAPMVHWPEVMLTYDKTAKILFSADAFGKFGTHGAQEPWEDEARRYYIGIVGKYGKQVQALLKKAASLEISAICPLHGPILTENLAHYIDLYLKWSAYLPEQTGVTVAFTSVYGNTREAVRLLDAALTERGIPHTVYDLARCDMSEATASAFRYDKLVLATTTYNADVFPFMKEYIHHLTERNFSSRTVALIENGSWAPMAARVMRGMLEDAKDITYTQTTVKIPAALDDSSRAQISALADELAK